MKTLIRRLIFIHIAVPPPPFTNCLENMKINLYFFKILPDYRVWLVPHPVCQIISLMNLLASISRIDVATDDL